MGHSTSTWRTADGLELFAQCWQPDTTAVATVCLVHGLGEHSGRYAHVAARLNAAGYALVGFDLRGHGRSQGPRGHAPSYDALLDDVRLLVRQAAEQFPALPAFLYGHSLGGTIVLSHALRSQPQVRGVVATGPVLRTAFAPPLWKLALGRLLRGVVPGFSMSNELDPNGLSNDPEVVEGYVGDSLVHDRVSARLAIDMLDAGRWALDHASEFPLPLLLMHGGADPICSVEASQQFAARVPGDCTLKVWDGLYHEIHNEPEQRQVLEMLVNWLRAHMPS